MSFSQLVVDSSSLHHHQSPALRRCARRICVFKRCFAETNDGDGNEDGVEYVFDLCIVYIRAIQCIYLLICTLYITHMTSIHTKSKYAFHARICTLANIIHRPHEPSAEVHISKSAQLLLAIQFSTLLLPWLWLSF